MLFERGNITNVQFESCHKIQCSGGTIPDLLFSRESRNQCNAMTGPEQSCGKKTLVQVPVTKGRDVGGCT